MSFDTTFRYFAFSPAILTSAGTLRDSLGSRANTVPGRIRRSRRVKTLLCGLDNVQTGKLRAMVLGETAQPITLSDGRLFLGGYWSLAVKAAFESGQVSGEELTEAQVKALQPVSDV